MNNFGTYLTPTEVLASKNVSITDLLADTIIEKEITYEELIQRSLNESFCSACGMEKVWKLANTELCFSCTTGEVDAGADIELKYVAILDNTNKQGIMLKHITVPIIIDGHEPEKCSYTCEYYRYVGYIPVCVLCNNAEITNGRCKQCIKEAK